MMMTLLVEEAPANFVPAAAVIRRILALFGFIGRKGSVDGKKNFFNIILLEILKGGRRNFQSNGEMC